MHNLFTRRRAKSAAARATVDWPPQFQQLGLSETQWKAVNRMGKPVGETTGTTFGVASATFKRSDCNARCDAVFVLNCLSITTRVTQ